MNPWFRLGRAVICAALALALSARLAAATVAPQDVGIDERLGTAIDRELRFTDQDGRATRLGDLFADGKPVVLVPAYYSCPMLCGLVLHGLATAVRGMDGVSGDDFHLCTVSFDPNDRPIEARRSRDAILTALAPRPPPAGGWPFLSGDRPTIARFLAGIGERVAPDGAGGLAHPAVVAVLTGDGRIARYLYGIDPSPRDLELALIEAGQGRIGSIGQRVVLSCYRYDPASRHYHFAVHAVLRLGGLGILAAMATGFLALRRRERRLRP